MVAHMVMVLVMVVMANLVNAHYQVQVSQCCHLVNLYS